MPDGLRAAIGRFLAAKRIAFIGLSRDPSSFSRYVYKNFLDRGYDAIPVNPHTAEVDGRPCYSRIQNITPVAEAALVMTPACESEQVVKDCTAAGIRRIWLHRGAGPGAVSGAALHVCAARNVEIVPGQCPMMFLCGGKFPHNVHAWMKRLAGSYPC